MSLNQETTTHESELVSDPAPLPQTETLLAPLRNALTHGALLSPSEVIISFAPYLNVLGKTFIPKTDLPDLTGRVILVTGGNTGIGKETVLRLAEHSPSRIYLAARNATKAEAAIQEIKDAVSGAQIEFLEVDLSSCASVKRAAGEFLRKEQRLDILINNAGIMGFTATKTTEGYDIQFGTNHVGHHLLTKLLIPTLLKTAELPELKPKGVRIVNVTSAGHYAAPSGGIVFDDINQEKAHMLTRYGQSKLANILETHELARRYPSITSSAVHPGLILTQLYDASRENIPLVGYWMVVFKGKLFMQSVEQGALNQLWAATSDEVESGVYYNPVGSKAMGSTYAQDGELARKLWDWTEADLAKHGY
ncbi:hypothetical protein FGG08_002447 [Glutinoglossum americanum]|uniref:NAD(P)-binding protein n=1 Tax=Glutinoglossum americanum TaxID=1670608 RepID=A0A9P8L4G6_9PEZI|nr:hypothetical protein FGG08_002447 [Glutinoglossum americanum]